MNILELAEQCGLSHLFIANEHNSTADQLRTIAGLEKFAELVIEEDESNAWISVNDELPDEDESVLCFNAGKQSSWLSVQTYKKNYGRPTDYGARHYVMWFDEDAWGVHLVTHWQPLPTLPINELKQSATLCGEMIDGEVR